MRNLVLIIFNILKTTFRKKGNIIIMFSCPVWRPVVITDLRYKFTRSGLDLQTMKRAYRKVELLESKMFYSA